MQLDHELSAAEVDRLTAPVSPQIGSVKVGLQCAGLDENPQKTGVSKKRPPLITVWLEVRVLPGPPSKSIADHAANLVDLDSSCPDYCFPLLGFATKEIRDSLR
jgi:hypothetical protein